jgi:hypothetical protein
MKHNHANCQNYQQSFHFKSCLIEFLFKRNAAVPNFERIIELYKEKVFTQKKFTRNGFSIINLLFLSAGDQPYVGVVVIIHESET